MSEGRLDLIVEKIGGSETGDDEILAELKFEEGVGGLVGEWVSYGGPTFPVQFFKGQIKRAEDLVVLVIGIFIQ
jgi:hypothetical protein